MTKYILVAEDDSDISALVRAVLEDAGFDVGVTVGSATLSAVRDRRPDLVMLDYQMPGMDGVRIARELKSDAATSTIPIVALTAAGHAATVCQAMDAQGCLGKPFEVDNLVAAVDKLIHLTHQPDLSGPTSVPGSAGRDHGIQRRDHSVRPVNGAMDDSLAERLLVA